MTAILNLQDSFQAMAELHGESFQQIVRIESVLKVKKFSSVNFNVLAR